MNRKIRTAIAVIAGLAALSSIGLTSVASAARPITEPETVTVAPVNGVAELVNTGGYWANIEGWKAQGFGGSATDADCQGYADAIYKADGFRLMARGASIGYWADRMDELDDEATDAGCVILYTPSSPA